MKNETLSGGRLKDVRWFNVKIFFECTPPLGGIFIEEYF